MEYNKVEAVDAVGTKLHGIAAKVYVMACAYTGEDGDAPTQQTTAAALTSLAEEIEAAEADLTRIITSK